MENLEIIQYKDVDLSNAMLILAFPTVGLTSSIAGRFIIDSLKLEEIGAVVSDKLMPATVIHKSNPQPPVRIYSGKRKCGPNGNCEQLAIIISEFMPPHNMIKPLADKILAWADEKNIQTIVTLEGTRAVGEKKKDYKVFGIGSNSDMKDYLRKYQIEQIQEGMITGVNGVLLYEGFLMKRDVVCLLAEAHSAFPDSRAAGNLLEKLDVMLPGIKIDPDPLYKEADKIEKDIRKFMEQSKPTAPAVSSTPMYR
jgi:uncharacterized protein